MPESSMLQVKLSFDNPYQVAFTVDSMRADVKLNDISVGELTSQTPFNVSGGERVSNNYDLVVETLPSGSALLSGVLHRGWICRVDGNVYVSMSGVAVTVPIHLSRKIL
jgi:LEA14-like dessication related protein